MKNKILFATAIACLSFNVANASIALPSPNHCPSVVALQGAPITLGEIDFNTSRYVAAAYHNSYDTNGTWMLVVGNIAATDATDAIKKATADIPHFVLMSDTPEPFMDAWACGYQSDLGYQVLAITSNSSTHSLSSLLTKIKT